MFAGGRLTIVAPLAFGEPAERTAAVARTERKRGRTGELVFVTVRSEVRQHGAPALVDEQDLVYRSGPATAPPAPVPASTVDGVRLTPDAVTLFQLSALTANSHRIHYDLPYARTVEGYPDLVVHGPLLVLAMAERWRADPSRPPITSLRYRLHRPLFLGEPASVTVESGTGCVPGCVISSGGSVRASATVNAEEAR